MAAVVAPEILVEEAQAKTKGHPALLAREFEDAESGGDSVRFMQFNILADGLSGRDKRKGGFTESPEGCLEWEFRKYRLLEEIARCNPDILCLEECDHYDDWFAPQLERLGMTGVFQKKPSSPCLSALGGPLEDGCAVFWKSEKFSLVENTVLNFIGSDGEQENQLAVICVLSSSLASNIVVAATHLKASKNEEGEERRANQAKQLMDRLALMDPSWPLFLCCDLNAAPEDGHYKALAYPAVMGHDMDVFSAYCVGGREPEYTTWKRRGEQETKHTIDYIFARGVAVVRRWRIPREVPPSRLPCFEYPSDHVALAADFTLAAI